MIDRKFVFKLIVRWSKERNIMLHDDSINDLTNKICRLFDIEGDESE